MNEPGAGEQQNNQPDRNSSTDQSVQKPNKEDVADSLQQSSESKSSNADRTSPQVENDDDELLRTLLDDQTDSAVAATNVRQELQQEAQEVQRSDSSSPNREEEYLVRFFFENYDQSIHAAPSEIKRWLAEKYNIYTTIEPREPGSFREFHKEMETARQLEQLRENTRLALKNAPGFKDGRLGSKLATVFGAVTDVKIDNVYVKPSDAGGTVAAETISYAVTTEEDAMLLSTTLSALLRTGSIEEVYPIHSGVTEDGSRYVQVHNMTEYTNRVLGNAIAQLVAQEDLRDTGTVLPLDKMDLKTWKARGETFHPDVEARLEALNQQYKDMDPEEAKEFRRSRGKEIELLGTDPAACFQVVRDAFRPKIHELRGGDHQNKEQNPIREERLLIENGVNLTRDTIAHREGMKHPVAPRAYTDSEILAAKGKQVLADAKENPLYTSAKWALEIAGVGVTSVGEILLDNRAPLADKVKDLESDYEKWRKQQAEVAKSRARIIQAVSTSQYGGNTSSAQLQIS